MQTLSDPRHVKRQDTVKELFAESFTGQPKRGVLTKKVWSKKDELDELIKSAAVAWPIDKLNKIDLAILRLAVYELVYDNSVPPKVVIDEAVELGKEFGGETTPPFVNGVLGTVFKGLEKKKG